VVDETDELVK
jgi:ribosomal protein S1